LAVPQRLKRVNALLKREISDIIRTEVNDPRIHSVHSTIFDVSVSADLKNAHVFVSVIEDDELKRAAALEGFKRAGFLIRSKLMDRVELRSIPFLHFKLDTSIERGVRVTHLINKLAEEEKEIREKNEDEK